MSELYKIPHDALVLACDARKALFLRNTGTPRKPTLTTQTVLQAALVGEPRNSDRPGRRADSIAGGKPQGPRSAMQQPDWQKLDADAFAAEICEALQAMHRQEALTTVILVAPPDMLGQLRKHMPAEIGPLIQQEIAKDLTPMPIDRMAQVISESE